MFRSIYSASVALTAAFALTPSVHAQCPQDSIDRPMQTAGDLFGAEVSTDGDLAAIGSLGAIAGTGEITFARRNASMRWDIVQQVPSTFGLGTSGFGSVLELDDDVLATGGTDLGPTFAPIVFMLVDDSGTWTTTAFVFDASLDLLSEFGTSLRIDGDVLLVGAPNSLGDPAGPLPGARTGSVFHFLRDRKGTPSPLDDTWDYQNTIYPPAAFALAGMRFGASVASDSGRLLVGAPRDMIITGPLSQTVGSAYAFDQTGSTWTFTQKLSGTQSHFEDFGASVDLSGDRAVVGAPNSQSGFAQIPGAGFTYDRSGGSWVLNAKLTGPTPLQNLARIGFDVDLEGELLVLGAPGPMAPSPGIPGRAFVYLEQGGNWDLIREHGSANPTNRDLYGVTVALTGGSVTGDLALIGSPGKKLPGPIDDVGVVEYRGTTLEACPPSIVASVGGTHTFSITAGAQHAGETYWMFGSASGTSPGLNLNGNNLPLVVDVYFNKTLYQPYSGAFTNFIGTLDPNGDASAALSVPADPSFAGITLYHAYAVSPTLGAPVELTSHATSLVLQ
ncbi:MAG: hypothetical protein DHS20C15_27360 [Planctomycetota bacterium]|nr:MAG: hypothetical protein DHS20C15_27360 [Planctomycetota bacterium]